MHSGSCAFDGVGFEVEGDFEQFFLPPQAHLFLGSRANWDSDLGELPGFDGLPQESP